MKKTLFLLMCAAATTQAAIVKFSLSPAGTDAAVGLSPLNEVPAVTNSTGSGNAVSGGIWFDTDTAILQFAIGYGSGAGFTDLSGPATALHIHGEAPAGQTAGVLANLAPFHFPYANPIQGGLIYGALQYPSNAVAGLLGGSNYVNIHTALNPGGEVRAQLIPLANSAPTVTCPASAVVECGLPTTTPVTVADPEGDALSVVWTLNGAAVQTNRVPAGAPGAAVNLSYTSKLPLGTNTLGIAVTDAAGNVTSCAATIEVVDTTPPVIERVSVSPNTLWPPNHQKVEVRVAAVVRDACGPARWRITDITSNEPENGLGDGDTPDDWDITGPHTAQLRAERSGKGNGRIYTLTIVATDTAGNQSAPSTVTVTVPKSQGRKK
jgi:hypothetical protein